MFRYIMLAALTGAMFLTGASTFATPAASTAPAKEASAITVPSPIVADDGPGLGGGY